MSGGGLVLALSPCLELALLAFSAGVALPGVVPGVVVSGLTFSITVILPAVSETVVALELLEPLESVFEDLGAVRGLAGSVDATRCAGVSSLCFTGADVSVGVLG